MTKHGEWPKYAKLAKSNEAFEKMVKTCQLFLYINRANFLPGPKKSYGRKYENSTNRQTDWRRLTEADLKSQTCGPITAA